MLSVDSYWFFASISIIVQISSFMFDIEFFVYLAILASIGTSICFFLDEQK